MNRDLINYEPDVKCFLIFCAHHLKLIKFNGNNQKERIIIATELRRQISASIYLPQSVKPFYGKQAMILDKAKRRI